MAGNGLFLLALAGSVAFVPRPWSSPVAAPSGAREYKATVWTQNISVLDGYDRIAWARITDLEAKWHGSGGLVKLKGWRSDKYRYIPVPGVKHWVGDIQVLNSLGYYQANRGILRSYPDGTRFDDVLTNTQTGKVFEHRTRTKVNGRWRSTVPYADGSQRPQGYEGLRQSCASCHNQAGSGGYAVGLVPGGDGVLSDPLDWSLVTGRKE